MATRDGHARWEGDLKSGKGTLKTATGSYEGPYSFTSRFEEGAGTNPEELIAAAHAGCYSMALSNDLASAGHTPESVETTAKVTLTVGADGAYISTIALDTVGVVPGLSADEFATFAEAAKVNCPVSKALTGPEITLAASLAG